MLVQNGHGSATVVIISKTIMDSHTKTSATICVGEITHKCAVENGTSVCINLLSNILTYTYTTKVST